MPQRQELPLQTPLPWRLPLHQQRDSVTQPECPVNTPMEYHSGTLHPVMFDGHKESVVANDPGPNGTRNQMNSEKSKFSTLMWAFNTNSGIFLQEHTHTSTITSFGLKATARLSTSTAGHSYNKDLLAGAFVGHLPKISRPIHGWIVVVQIGITRCRSKMTRPNNRCKHWLLSMVEDMELSILVAPAGVRQLGRIEASR